MKLLALASTVSLAAAQSYNSPPYYPSPKGGWVSDWSASYEKAAALVQQMTLAEKVNITTSVGWQMGRCVGNTGPVPRLGIPSFCAQDGPLGVRNADLITAFPAGITVGASWNEELIYQRGYAIGTESKAKGVHVILGPSVGPLGRSPLGGRNWEGFGSDPYLSSVGAYQGVRGIQDAGAQACIKHFIANEQEHFRGDGQTPNTVSANVDDRTMHEVYLPPFAAAVRAGVASVMCSYNMINGSYGCQNSWALNGLLKEELGFQGYVMADWLAQRSGVGAMLAGMDQTQPGDGASWANGQSFWGPELSRAVLNSSVPVDRLNDAVTRIVAAWYQLGQDKDYPKLSFSAWTKDDMSKEFFGADAGPMIRVNDHIDVRGNHGELARQIAREGIVLLKNVDNILPLKTSDVIRVFGSDAGPNPNGGNSCVDRGCNSGVLGMGWGSGTADYYPDIETPISAIEEKASNVQSHLSDTVNSALTQLASTPNARCLVFISSDSGESYITVDGNLGDRNNLSAWHNGDALVKAVADLCENTIVVIHAVGTIDMEQWIEHPNVKAVLHAHLPGREAGKSLTDILFGDYSPSGHLPYTIGKKLADYGPVDIIRTGSGRIDQPFTEKLNIDYKHFDAANITPRFEFGFGLSYTTFSLSAPRITLVKEPTALPPSPPAKLPVPSYPTAIPAASEVAWPASIRTRIQRFIYPYLDNPGSITPAPFPYPDGYSTTPKPASPAGGAQGGNPALYDVIYRVAVTVTNTGAVTAKAVPQLYVEFPESQWETPVRSLSGFGKVELQPGEGKEVVFEITRKDLSVWDVVRQNWVIPGEGARGHVFRVGQSSRKLSLSCETGGLTCSVDGGEEPVTTISTTATATATATATGTVVPTTTAVPLPTQTDGPKVPKWQQCGGIGWTGGTVCEDGSRCVVLNDYYHQCQ